MSANNQAVIIGRAGNNPSEDTRSLQNGSSISEVRLAVNRNSKDASGNPITDWITCQFWDKNGARLSEFVKKGDLISVSGSIRVDNWEKEGEKRSKVYINGENFQMLESRQAREERNGPSGGSNYSAPARSDAPAAKPKDDFSDDFALDDDELPPF